MEIFCSDRVVLKALDLLPKGTQFSPYPTFYIISFSKNQLIIPKRRLNVLWEGFRELKSSASIFHDD